MKLFILQYLWFENTVAYKRGKNTTDNQLIVLSICL